MTAPLGEEGEFTTLRDRFAVAALQGLLATGYYASTPQAQGSVAERAYRIADALLREREKPIDHQFAKVEP